MNKAFVKEGNDEPLSTLPEMPLDVRNYVTPAGYTNMQAELRHLLEVLRAAKALEGGERDDMSLIALGDSGEMHMREIEQRIYYLQTRLDTAEIVDPAVHADEQKIFFGATVTYQNGDCDHCTVTIVGLDEIDPSNGKISWLSPIAQALLNAFEGDSVMMESPVGNEELRILTVLYPSRVEPDTTSASLTRNSAG